MISLFRVTDLLRPLFLELEAKDGAVLCRVDRLRFYDGDGVAFETDAHLIARGLDVVDIDVAEPAGLFTKVKYGYTKRGRYIPHTRPFLIRKPYVEPDLLSSDLGAVVADLYLPLDSFEEYECARNGARINIRDSCLISDVHQVTLSRCCQVSCLSLNDNIPSPG